MSDFKKDEKKLDIFIKDHSKAGLDLKTVKLLDYAVKLTNAPSSITENDIVELRKTGLTDESILNVNLITAYFNMVNRTALGLGVTFSEDEVQGYKFSLVLIN